MSNAVMNAVFKHSQSKGAARLVLLSMADEANDEGLLTAYKRSHSHLASKANVDGSSVTRATKVLVDLGELEILRRGDGRASTNYRIVLPGIEIEGVQDATPAPAARHPRGSRLTPQGVQDATPIIPFSPGTTQEPTTGAGKRRRMPDPFVVTSKMQEWAIEKYPAVNWREQTEQFRDHHRGNGTTKLDWEATWRTWIRNAGTRFAPRSGNAPEGSPRLSKSRQNSDRVFERMMASERDRSQGDDRLGGGELATGDHRGSNGSLVRLPLGP